MKIGNRQRATLKFLLRAFSAMLLVFCASTDAQTAAKIFRIGFLDPSTASGSGVLWDILRAELSKLGWIEGKNIAFEYRFAESKGPVRVSTLAAELVNLKVDLTSVRTLKVLNSVIA